MKQWMVIENKKEYETVLEQINGLMDTNPPQ